jgi:hypothetical protein
VRWRPFGAAVTLCVLGVVVGVADTDAAGRWFLAGCVGGLGVARVFGLHR